MEDLPSERWAEVEAILGNAMKLPAHARTSFLKEACAGNPTVRAEIEALLDADANAGSFLEEAAHEYRALVAALVHEEAEPETKPLGKRLGAYQVVKEISRGGMGTVYLAERVDGAFEKQVALKLIKRGMDTDAVVRRFLAERQILARLRHDNIARLLDGGVIGEDEPYFVMEYISGLPITAYCDTHRLDIAARLRLFQQVCRAVQYAHRNLVVHRDLKPSNILVTEGGQVKLLDFGIAKLLSDRSLKKTALTQTGGRVMTPEYASPEQVRGEAVTTATDVYALGVILYELLIGRRPYQLANRSAAEVERVICEVEPEAPSMAMMQAETIVRRDGTTEVLTPEQISRARSTQADRLRRRLRGDLDTMVMKALKKDPERRYASAEALLEDIHRHLAGLPVSAQRDAVGYRVKKFVRRHQVGVSATAVLAVMLVALIVLLVQRVWQADEVRREAAKSDQIKEFVVSLFEVSDPNKLESQHLTARALLDRGVKRIEELEGQPAVQAELMHVLGVVYRQMGVYDQAQALLEQSLALRQGLFGDRHVDVASSLRDLAWLFRLKGNFDKAEQLYGQALEARRNLYKDEHLDLAASLNDWGIILSIRGKHDEAESFYQEALAMRRKLLGEEHELVASVINNLGLVQWEKANFDAAEPFLREALEMRHKLLGPKHPESLQSLNNLGALFYAKEDYEAAGPLYREALALKREAYGEEHPEVAVGLNNLGGLLYARGKHDEAEQVFRKALEISRKLEGEHHPSTGQNMNNLAVVLHEKGSYKEAELLLRKALNIYSTTLPEHHRSIGNAASRLGRVLLDSGRPDEAEPLLRKALDIRVTIYGEEHKQSVGTGTWLGIVLAALRRYEEAELLLLGSYTFYKNEGDQEEIQKALAALIDLYTAWGRPEQAAAYKAVASEDETM